MTTAIASLIAADFACAALEPQFLADLTAAQAGGDPDLIARHQQRFNLLRAVREAIGKCIDRARQVT